ncbi:N-acetylmuramoyl-L-alanine amidase family protein [Sphingobacterium sp. 1.A.4]|uniref:N-acetylmuramoyl-L-alanine amidase family protein n=1 Tax=Sphingobacterium sp. 1.A.4 TaxID=2044603 RepID=UPI000C0BF291|nr:N-acetylmuramoyl-L-alanine amidase [Sphingobacterium sp. 1.A.4]
MAICLSVIVLASFTPKDPQNPNQSGTVKKMRTIVLDAGHGGHDSGAVGRVSKEKDIALQVALKLGKRIEQELPGVKVVYTRKTDIYPKLYERPAIANKHNADLFISIHCNSGGTTSRRVKNSRGKYVTQKTLNTSAAGTETLVLGFSRTGQQDVAIRENASILMEENYKENYGGFDPKDPSSYIIFSLIKRKYREQSIRLASYMQDQFKGSNRTDRGVKEQSLAVLATAGMPAVLTEIGFISNPEEERYMNSAAGQEAIVTDLFNAINTYRKAFER